MKKYSHAYDFAFEVESYTENASDVTPAMIRAALVARALRLSDTEIPEACGLYDTGEVQPPTRLPHIIVDGYWRDDRTEFEGYVISQTHDVEEDDDSIFFYGLTESEIAESLGKETAQDFVITAYEVATY